MLTSRSVQALIALEDSAPDVLLESLEQSGVFIWPQIRMMFAQASASTELGSTATGAVMSRWTIASQLIRAVLPTSDSARGYRGRRDYCFLVGGTTLRETSRGVENWLVDPFANAVAEQSVIIQDRPLSRSDSLRPAFSDTYSFDQFHSLADLKTRFSPLSESASRQTRNAVREIARNFDYPLTEEQTAFIERRALKALAHVRHIDKGYLRVLDRIAPKVVFIEDASYGSRGHLISVLKQRGVTVVEPQHGWIGPSHAAYNFGSIMSAPELKQTLPDVLMTFGDFWSNRIRHPAEVVSIGKAQLEESVRNLPDLASRPNTVLVVSSVAEPREMADFTLAIRDALPADWTVKFRPHPSERSTLTDRYPSLVNARRVEFDEESDVYQSMLRVRGVVGTASTVVYEALAMGCHVFVKDSPFAAYYIDEVFGELLRDPDSITQLAKTLTESVRPSHSVASLQSFWKPNAKSNFLAHLPQWQGTKI